MGLGEAELSRQALAELRRLGDTASLQLYDAAVAVVEGRPNDARSLLMQRLKNEPRDGYANILLWRLRGSSDDYRNTLRQVTQYRSLDPNDLRSDEPYSALVCLNAWPEISMKPMRAMTLRHNFANEDCIRLHRILAWDEPAAA